MPARPFPTSPATPSGRPALLLALLLASAIALQAPLHAQPPAPLPAAEVESLLADAARGEVFALETALPRIAEPQLTALARARIAAARLDHGEALRQLEPLLAPGASTDPAHLLLAWPIVADASFAAGDYARAAHATDAWRALLAAHGDPDGRAGDVAQFHAVSTLLAPTRPQTLLAFAPETVATRPDTAGLTRATVTINGHGQDTVLDTGANLSVVSASTAQRLGLHLLDGEASVGSTSRDAVATRIGIAERLEFAGATLADVAFLVLDDAQLEIPIPGGYRIDAILGFPVLQALGRIRFGADGSLAAETSEAAADAAPGNLRVVGSDLYVALTIDDLPLSLHLDTGAPQSSLSARFAQRHPARLEGLRRERQQVGGAGGVTTRETALWPGAQVRLDGRETVLPELAIAVEDSADVGTRNLGILGGDVLGAFAAYTIDFARMRLELGEPLDAAAPDAGEAHASDGGARGPGQ
ncbi:retropepsin-like domain-containing protein [Luteimonas sp. SJ-92]|uniref:Retropepsin-like domain-containing protein n=1 Tax=Luteimonas salinisoli TaxID=2752307 RepID=A0A853JAI9_9GAMM|nr:retropepsin-like aspartic protease [Luteimonas salinisoli]NZA25650.1 retropepsin-like domain-containing protein [Luteimonas salinisoli]